MLLRLLLYLLMVLLRLLAFKPSGTVAPTALAPTAQLASGGSAAVPGKKPLPELAVRSQVERARASAPAAAPAIERVPEAVQGAPAEVLTATEPLESSRLGDTWSQIVNQLVVAEAIAALTRELALQSELCSQEGGVWSLRVERESLSQPAAREKLQTALQLALADSLIKLSVEVGPVTDSPARRNGRALAEKQRAAEALIHTDPFVLEVIRDWGAKIVPGSIKSVAS